MPRDDLALKYGKANAIVRDPHHTPCDFAGIDPRAHGEIVEINVARQSNLSTRIRVRTRTHGTHWYTLSLKEDR